MSARNLLPRQTASEQLGAELTLLVRLDDCEIDVAVDRSRRERLDLRNVHVGVYHIRGVHAVCLVRQDT